MIENTVGLKNEKTKRKRFGGEIIIKQQHNEFEFRGSQMVSGVESTETRD